MKKEDKNPDDIKEIHRFLQRILNTFVQLDREENPRQERVPNEMEIHG